MGVGGIPLYTSKVFGPMLFFLILRINFFLWALSLLFSHAVALSLITFFRVSTSESSESNFGEITSTSGSLLYRGSLLDFHFFFFFTCLRGRRCRWFLKPHMLALCFFTWHVVVFSNRYGLHFSDHWRETGGFLYQTRDTFFITCDGACLDSGSFWSCLLFVAEIQGVVF